MSEAGEDQNDKPYEATRRKLEEARKKGEIARSQDAVALVALAVLILATELMFRGYMTDIVQHIRDFVALSVSARATLNGAAVFAAVTTWLVPFVLIFFAAPFVLIFAGMVATKQVLFTADKIKPKLNRLSLLSNAKRKFGWSGLFEFAKNLAKFLIFAALLTVFVRDGFELFQILVVRSEHAVLGNIYEVALRWLWCTLATYMVFAVIDVVWQAHDHARKNRMSHREMKDEHKNEEGDENIRQKRRAKAEEIATNRMLLDVPKASVVITNPTHFAVALQWGGEIDTVPKCVARGTDETARKIREIAIQSGVPLYRDPATARELYAKVKVGTMIEPKHYKAVAIAIGYARRIHSMVKNGQR